MDKDSRVEAAADFLWQAHEQGEPFQNLPPHLAASSIDEAYAMQEAFHRRAIPRFGPIAGLKIATTTKVMQAFMGIDHPCGGAIFASRVLSSGSTIRRGDYAHVMAECEIAMRLGRDICQEGRLSGEDVLASVTDIAPVFELIEDRFANHQKTAATTLIADNAWNAGVVHGPWCPFDPSAGLGDVQGVLAIDGEDVATGRPDDPFGALAWVAMLAVRRGRPLRTGMVVITGSLIATFELDNATEVIFSLGQWGETRLRIEGEARSRNVAAH